MENAQRKRRSYPSVFSVILCASVVTFKISTCEGRP